jgi:malonyl-CoA/methylmalonyl-CoA synthetase
MIFLHEFDVDSIIECMPKASVLMGVPTFYQRLLSHPELGSASKSMRLFISGSAPLLEDTHRRWREQTGHAILERYGMTETNMNTSNPYDGERRAGTVGFALPGVEVIVAEPRTGESLPAGETGSIEIRGENLFSGYWKMPEKTNEEFRENGFFISGDLGKFDEDGYLHIVGRSKDLIISGGYNIYPKEIEALIDEIDSIAESAVIGVRHADLGEAVIAIVVAQSEKQVDESAILSNLSNKLARFKQPRRILVVDELPRNAMGKVQKNELRSRYNDILYPEPQAQGQK